MRGKAFNFSNEIQVTVIELVNRILEKMDSSLEPDIRNEASNEIRHQYLSAEQARKSWDGGRCLRWTKVWSERFPGIAIFWGFLR